MVDWSRKEYFAQLFKLPVAAGALICDDIGRVLLLKPKYREQWLIPGGMVETDESPIEAATREIKEEIGLEITLQSLLCLEYKPSQAADINDRSLQFVFDGGVITGEQIQTIQLQVDECIEYRFCTLTEITGVCSPGLEHRIKESLRAKEMGLAGYLENGQKI